MVTFVLVHGTFAKSADWPALECGLNQVAHANGQNATIEQVTWTGHNRAIARQAAASEISNLVIGIRSRAPNERIFLVGHSHGGSAIAYFLKNYRSPATAVDGCAFLSTPFVAIRRRNEAIPILMVLTFFQALAFGTLWHLINKPSVDLGAKSPFALYMDMPAVWWWGMFAFAAVMLIVGFLISEANSSVDRVIEQQTADLPSGRYLFLRCSGDEAAAALSAAQFAAWLGMKVSRVMARLMRPAFSGRPSIRAVFVALFASILSGVTGFTVRFLPDWLDLGFAGFREFFAMMLSEGRVIQALVVTFVITAAICLPVLFLIGVLASLTILMVQSMTTRAFGWTGFLTGFLVELAIEPLPFGNHSMTHIDWRAGTGTLEGIVHSWTYAHPAAIEQLQEWIRSTLRPDAA
ncbi:hypothetical protein EDE08_10421 [Bradyrhizobium sp. R2.2-H]|jgi:pimeloyl-ACP methyl ester carboxylesterase|uniref:esterase/lipase family protein n=1 Tax=unclassified Bradyrhizobium TaxID=2631580 RepID=UPI001053A113|nr:MULTISPECIES: alpha/beta hydrolase [unclassified Bradyrhizobium]TCU73951.1 hypothetical protein EDE10_104621 [Bradyrhizobium sp. Y-H1]TCU75859.1 hypothetical protein EDE08_10421 [Bradyrhizobium sp. R2.2-H]